jgi:hypothetical protein
MSNQDFAPAAKLLPSAVVRWINRLLMLAVIAGSSVAFAQSPRIFFSDLDSGPNSGGESVSGFSGAYVTLYGNFLGSSQGTSTVTWNGLNCLRVLPATGSYTGWGMPYFWYQKIIVQLGSSCTTGTGNFVVTTSAGTSNGVSFTIRSGHIYFVSTSGSDSNSGSATSPWATLTNARNNMVAGDTTYLENGVQQNSLDNYSAALSISTAGSSGNPQAVVGYPGAAAGINVNNSQFYGVRIPNIGIDGSYWTFAGLTISGSEGMNPTGQTGSPVVGYNWRVVANSFSCPTANGETGCFETNQMNNVKFYGNEVTNVSTSLGFVANKQQHAVYFSTDSNHNETAWNYIHDNMSCRAIQYHSSPLNSTSGYNMYDLSAHDNYIINDPCDGINFATVDPSQGKIEAYNNVIVNTGTGPSPQGGDSGDYSCIYFAYITNNGSNGGGTAEIYNNTLVNCGSYVGPYNAWGAFVIAGAYTGLVVDIRNTIASLASNEAYISSNGASSTYVTGTNNIWYGGQGSAPSYTSNNLTSNPQLVSATNFHLQSTSPAIGAGLAITSANTYNGYAPWQGGSATDHDGLIRPSPPSIGAYEYAGVAGGQPPAAPTNLTVTVQ